MSRSILPESKEIKSLHTNDSKDKSVQLGQIYRINKKEGNYQRYNNNNVQQHGKQVEFYNNRSKNPNNKQNKTKYSTDDYF
jgi:hypothetical protein